MIHQEASPSLYEFDTNGDVAHTRRSDDNELVNPNAEYELIKGLAVSGYVRNLFSKEYITNNRDEDIIDEGAPRTAGMTLRYDL